MRPAAREREVRARADSVPVNEKARPRQLADDLRQLAVQTARPSQAEARRGVVDAEYTRR